MLRALLLAVFIPAFAVAADPLAGLDAVIAKGLNSHGVPGVGVAVIQDGKVILAKGYGSKSLGGQPVTADTLFAIGSVSKSVTATLIAMLVDDGKLGWDDPVHKHLNNFQMQDRWLTEEITLRDTLCHRVGLERNELVWYGAPYSRMEIIDRLRLIKLDKRIRSTFTYNNILYMAAGETAASATSKSWDDLIHERIFTPLNMPTANTSITKFGDASNVATPHEKRDGKPIAVKWKNIDNIGPAGSINASAKEMAEYVKFHLAKGKAGPKRLVKRDTFEVLHRPHVTLPRSSVSLNPDAKWHTYGLGWMVSDRHGHTWIEHGGNIDGMTASVMFLPDDGIGVVVLANLGTSLLPEALGLEIIDRMLGKESANLVEASTLFAWAGEYGLRKAMEPDESARIKNTKPTFELKKYTGTYTDKILAPVIIDAKDDTLLVSFNGIHFTATHWHYDTFVAKDNTGVFPRILFTFEQGEDGRVASVKFTPLADELLRFKQQGK
jgi:CubicO group peptidase (beta-lactamase class C family)